MIHVFLILRGRLNQNEKNSYIKFCTLGYRCAIQYCTNVTKVFFHETDDNIIIEKILIYSKHGKFTTAAFYNYT